MGTIYYAPSGKETDDVMLNILPRFLPLASNTSIVGLASREMILAQYQRPDARFFVGLVFPSMDLAGRLPADISISICLNGTFLPDTTVSLNDGTIFVRFIFEYFAKKNPIVFLFFSFSSFVAGPWQEATLSGGADAYLSSLFLSVQTVITQVNLSDSLHCFFKLLSNFNFFVWH